jgi:hypothetical protein
MVAFAFAFAVVAVAGAATLASGCVGGRFEPKTPALVLDPPTRVIVDRINSDRAARAMPPADWVPDLGPPALRAARSVARGDQSLTAATRLPRAASPSSGATCGRSPPTAATFNDSGRRPW